MDISGFLSDEFETRTRFINIPELRIYFEKEINSAVQGIENPTDADVKKIESEIVGIRVRGLTGQEYGRANKQASERLDIASAINGLLGGQSTQVQKAIQDLYGLGEGEISKDDSLAIYCVTMAIVSPEIETGQRIEFVKKLYRFMPIDFKRIAYEVMKLTGAGHIPGRAAQMFKDINVKNALAIAYEKKQFLFQANPDLFPYNYCTPLETELWGLFYAEEGKKYEPNKNR